MARKAALTAPQIDAIRLVGLTDSDGADLAAHGSYDGLRFTSVDLSDRSLRGASFVECDFADVTAHATDLRSATFSDTRMTRLNAPVFVAPRSRWRDVLVDSSRLGSAEFFDAEWSSVHLVNCKLGFVNLRGANLRDVLFTDCTIDELDLSGATATRIAFANTRATSLDLSQATLTHADLRGLDVVSVAPLEGLRGTTMTPQQIIELAPLFADSFGIRSE